MFDPVEKLKEHLRFPSVSTDSKFKEGMDGSRRFLEGLFTSMGLGVETVNTPMHPIVLARREGDRSGPTFLFTDTTMCSPLIHWESGKATPLIRSLRMAGSLPEELRTIKDHKWLILQRLLKRWRKIRNSH